MRARILEDQGDLKKGDIVELWPKVADVMGQFVKIGETGSLYIRYGYLVLPDQHYHVSAGLPGCIPEYNEVYESLQDARENLAWYMEPTCVQFETRYDCLAAGEEYFYQERGEHAIGYVQIFKCSDCEMWEDYQREIE